MCVVRAEYFPQELDHEHYNLGTRWMDAAVVSRAMVLCVVAYHRLLVAAVLRPVTALRSRRDVLEIFGDGDLHVCQSFSAESP